MTLKAGSILTLTGSTYATITTTVDRVKSNFSLNPNSTYVMFTVNNGVSFAWKKIEKVGSGESLPADNTNYDNFFLTTDKIIYIWSNGSWSSSDITYPICLIQTDENGNLSFVKDSNGNDMIFNGAGFVGHHAIIYPDVTGLIPNGKNLDGSLKTIEATTNSLSIHEMVLGTGSYGDGSRYFAISTTGNITGWGGYTIREKDEDFTNDNWLRQYIKESNKTYTWTGSEKQQMYETPFINYKCDTNGLVTKFDISQPLTKYRWVVKLIP